LTFQHNSFLSVINIIQNEPDTRLLRGWLEGVFGEIHPKFSDWEVILVNNIRDQTSINQAIEGLPAELRKHIFLLNLSTPVNRNHAILAGLDRANGDFTAIFEFQFSAQPELLTALFEKSQTGFDIVYLRGKSVQKGLFSSISHRIFHFILRKNSKLALDDRAHDTRIISRRALNSLLKMRENMRYMKAIYALVGYQTAALDVENRLPEHADESLREQMRTSLVAITSYTTFLRSVMGWMFLFSVLFAAISSFNAIKVKLTNVDIFGERVESLSGWAFLVVLISVFFAITCLNLYIISIYLSNIYQEMKGRPPYIIESTRRF
jgi:hypothetical protein